MGLGSGPEQAGNQGLNQKIGLLVQFSVTSLLRSTIPGKPGKCKPITVVDPALWS